MDREEEREERPGEVRGEAVEGEDEGVVGGVGMVSLGLGQFEFGASGEEEEDDELDKEGSGLRVEGVEGLGFGVAELPVSDGSIAEKHIGQQISETKTLITTTVIEYLKTAMLKFKCYGSMSIAAHL